VLLGLAVALMVVGVAGNALGLLEEGTTDWIAVAGLALLVVSQAIRGWIRHTLRPVLVLALAAFLLALVVLDVF
jgi:isoprenylcysteine carboxyl methyltransferase (ICMT) family protein YpbQ